MWDIQITVKYAEIDKNEDCFGELTEEDTAEQLKQGVQTEDVDQESDDDDEVKVPDPSHIAKAFDTVRKSRMWGMASLHL